MISRRLGGALLGALLMLPMAAEAETPPRTVVLGGTLAEIIAALGAEDQLVGRDGTASYPESLLELPDVGYMRAVSPEGVLALSPDLIIADPGVGPESAVEVLTASTVDYVTIPYDRSPEGVIDKIRGTAAALGRDDEGEELATKVQAQLDEAAIRAAAIPEDQRIGVLFVMSLQGDEVMVGGMGSTPDSLIAMAGARNVAAEINGYKVMTDEAIITAAPDVILMAEGGMDAALTEAAIEAHPALSHTPAAQSGRIVTIDGMLVLGFGPRVGTAVLDLNEAFYHLTEVDAQP